LEARHVIPVASLIDKLVARSSLIEGISVVGGEPMHQARALGALLEGIRQAGLSTVVYSGFTLDYLLKQDNVHIEKVLANTDILVDGPYVDGLQDLSLVWRGSTNQKIRFLTDRYTSKDVPPQDEYTNIEVHTYQQDGQETAIVRKTGITF
jgi:anaerobic ribonucleoside-triphosphate reductase activating protein